jgi:hypothetical protein
LKVAHTTSIRSPTIANLRAVVTAALAGLLLLGCGAEHSGPVATTDSPSPQPASGPRIDVSIVDGAFGPAGDIRGLTKPTECFDPASDPEHKYEARLTGKFSLGGYAVLRVVVNNFTAPGDYDVPSPAFVLVVVGTKVYSSAVSGSTGKVTVNADLSGAVDAVIGPPLGGDQLHVKGTWGCA